MDGEMLRQREGPSGQFDLNATNDNMPGPWYRDAKKNLQPFNVASTQLQLLPFSYPVCQGRFLQSKFDMQARFMFRNVRNFSDVGLPGIFVSDQIVVGLT